MKSLLIDGAYNATVGYGWSGTVTPVKAGYTFNPPNRQYTNVDDHHTGQSLFVGKVPDQLGPNLNTRYGVDQDQC